MRGNPGSGRPVAWMVAVVSVAWCGGRPADGATVDGGRLGRWSVSGYAEAYGVWASEHGSQRQRPQGILDTRVTGEVHPKARVFLDVRGLIGGPPEDARGLGFANINDTFQNISPEVEIPEGYLDLFLPSLDVRVGKQKFAWGKLDTFQPTDVLNPGRYTDPFVTEEEDAKIGVPAVRASYFPPALGPRFPTDTSLTMVWVPVPVAVRFPLPGERWFPSELLLPPAFSIDKGALGTSIPRIDVEQSLQAVNVQPPRQLDEGALGLRLAGLYADVDWALYYYNGPETAPAFENVAALRARDRFVSPQGAFRVHADVDLQPRFGRIWLAGGDAAIPLGGFTARIEGAYGANRLLPRPASAALDDRRLTNKERDTLLDALPKGETVQLSIGELAKERDTIEWGMGVDYRYRGWMPVLQVNQTVVLHNSVELLVNNVDTRLFFVVRKSFLGDRLGTEVGAVQGLERSYTSAIARFTYAVTDSWRVRLGYLLIAGTMNSRIGQYHDNDEAFLQIRYAY